MLRLHLTFLIIALVGLGGCATFRTGDCPRKPEQWILRAHDAGAGGVGRNPSYIIVDPDTRGVTKDCHSVLKNPMKKTIKTTSEHAWLDRQTWVNTEIEFGKAVGGKIGDIFEFKVHVKDIGVLDPRARMK